jgi:hypothetical protein
MGPQLEGSALALDNSRVPIGHPEKYEPPVWGALFSLSLSVERPVRHRDRMGPQLEGPALALDKLRVPIGHPEKYEPPVWGLSSRSLYKSSGL